MSKEINITETYHYINWVIRSFHFDDSTKEDLAQEIIIKVLINKHSFESRSKYKTWVYSIARNHCINYKKRRYDIYKKFQDWDDNSIIMLRYNEVNSDETISLIRKCIRELPLIYRIVIVYYFFYSMKYKEISEELNVPIGTIKSRLNTGKRLLKYSISRELFFRE
ncbi:RNA polymerase sigma factor [Spirochaeta cellobiosiphila]|uniref:RNA polymerase sigma factor n=1 Tax=Spirochaeta cellobiosiphila TaxID=504483 RepID=UPI00040A2BE8|nr:RNA polymerase sigma factor [Spirochaeta cellobiosiphila]